MPLEGRSLSSRQRLGSESEEIDPMGLRTPEKIGKLQRTFYAKAKEQPGSSPKFAVNFVLAQAD